MKLNWKRVILFGAFVLTAILIGYLLYFFFLKPAIPVVTPGVNVNVGPGGLPPANVNANIPVAGNVNGGLPGGANANLAPPPPPPSGETASAVATGGLTQTTALTSVRAYQPTLAADGNSVIYYDKTTGLFYRINADGRATPISDQVFYDVEKVTWSPDKNLAILEYPDSAKIIYDFSAGKQVSLPKHWKDFSFSPQNNQLVFKSLGTSDSSRWLAVAKADGSEATKIENLGANDATVYPAWSPNSQIVALYTEGQGLDRQNLNFVGLNNENFKSTVIEGRGFAGQWSTTGNRLLYSVYSSASDLKPTLWIVEAQGDSIGQNRKNLKLETWADKCTFSNNDTIYCAVPQSLSEGAGLFRRELDTAACDIYKIDLTTGFKTKIAIPAISQNIEQLIVSGDSRYLYYSSLTDGKLYKINLK